MCGRKIQTLSKRLLDKKQQQILKNARDKLAFKKANSLSVNTIEGSLTQLSAHLLNERPQLSRVLIFVSKQDIGASPHRLASAILTMMC